MWTQGRQWRRKRVLMRPEAAFPYVFAAEGAQHPPNKPPRSTTLTHQPPRSPALVASSATLNDPAQLLQKNRDQSVGRHFGLCLLCQMVLCPEPLDC